MTTATTRWYDTREGFEKALEGGLGGLKEIASERRTAGYDRKERLGIWYVLGYFCFDSCGNTMVITEGRPDYYTFGKYLPQILTEKELKEGKQHGTMTMTHGSIPPAVQVCPRCLEGWTLRNVATHKSVRNRQDDSWENYHKRCYDLKVTQSEIAFFTEILEESGIVYIETRWIPAEYPDRPAAPWFMVETTLGPIKIGYRRRVISIEWQHAEGLKEVNGEELFKEEGVTTDRCLVHAWGKEKAVEYLKALMAPGANDAPCMSYCKIGHPHEGECVPMEGR